MTEHKKTLMHLEDESVMIDTDIAPLIEVLNKYGIKTLHSCQGDRRGYISLDHENVELWIGKINGELQQMFNLRFPKPKKGKTMTEEEASEKGYAVENYAGGFILCDYSGKRGSMGAGYMGADKIWYSQPIRINAPFEKETEAWTCAD
jgi:hypothetical protein